MENTSGGNKRKSSSAPILDNEIAPALSRPTSLDLTVSFYQLFLFCFIGGERARERASERERERARESFLKVK